MNGDIAEILVYNRQLNTAEINILSNHFSAKYALPAANNLYSGDDPGLGNYDFNVFGVGSDAATTGFTAGSVTSGSSGNGLNIVSTGSLDQGDYVLAGDTNGAGGFTALSGESSRWTRIWYLQQTGESNVDLEFNFAEYGEGSFTLLPGYYFSLLYSETDPLALEGLGLDYTWDGNTVTFSLLGSELESGYYTLAMVAPTPEPATAWLLSCGALALLQLRRRKRNVSRIGTKVFYVSSIGTSH